MTLFSKLCVLAVAVAGVSATTPDMATRFSEWKVQWGKTYPTAAAHDHAFHNFQASIARSAELNAKNTRGSAFGLTKFSDLSPAEFKAQYLNSNVPEGLPAGRQVRLPSKPMPKDPPATWDWRNKGCVTPVKDQEQCGSCWAFSATENMESMWILAGNQNVSLAPEQMVDCDPQSSGCGGGWTYWAFEYLMSVGGQESEADYPYTGDGGTCAFQKADIVATIKNYTFAIPPCESGGCTTQDLKGLRAALATIGPFSICVNAGSWSDYTGGVVSFASCDGAAGDIDHCVQLVGYDWNQGYWIVRNSWNTNWGEEGYIFLDNSDNTCGLADVVTYADVA